MDIIKTGDERKQNKHLANAIINQSIEGWDNFMRGYRSKYWATALNNLPPSTKGKNGYKIKTGNNRLAQKNSELYGGKC